MDGDRFRTSDRRVVNGSSADARASRPAYREEDERGPAPQPTQQSEPPRYERAPRREEPAAPKRRRGPFIVILAILLIALLGFGGWLLWTHQQKSNTGIDTGKYQAVFLSNGQHYFGKLQSMNDEYFKLSDVYYLEQKSETGETKTATTPTQQTAVELRKLGEKEIHGPEDTMIISKDQVLLYENLTDKSQVVSSINQHKQQAK